MFVLEVACAAVATYEIAQRAAPGLDSGFQRFAHFPCEEIVAAASDLPCGALWIDAGAKQRR
jgi:hypothetical protein